MKNVKINPTEGFCFLWWKKPGWKIVPVFVGIILIASMILSPMWYWPYPFVLWSNSWNLICIYAWNKKLQYHCTSKCSYSSAFELLQICTIPLDTAKVRLQLQKKAVAGEGLALPKYRGMLGTVATIAREEGLTALWKGIVPGLHRQCLFGGLRIGLYEPVGLKSYFSLEIWAILHVLFGCWQPIYVH